jgi:hypothetical protein
LSGLQRDCGWRSADFGDNWGMSKPPRSSPFAALFVDHPKAVGETYLAHLGVSWRFSSRLLVAGLAGMIHGLVPGLFERTASTTVRRLNAQLPARGVGDEQP